MRGCFCMRDKMTKVLSAEINPVCFRDGIPIVPQTEVAQEEDEEDYTYTESFLNDYTFTEKHTEEHKEDPVEPHEIKRGEFT